MEPSQPTSSRLCELPGWLAKQWLRSFDWAFFKCYVWLIMQIKHCWLKGINKTVDSHLLWLCCICWVFTESGMLQGILYKGPPCLLVFDEETRGTVEGGGLLTLSWAPTPVVAPWEQRSSFPPCYDAPPRNTLQKNRYEKLAYRPKRNVVRKDNDQ